MANKFRGEVDIILGGNQYVLRPTFEALVEFEDRSGKTAYEAMRDMVEGRGFSAKVVCAAFYAGMRAGWPPVSHMRMPSYGEVGALIQAEGLMNPAVMAAFGAFLTRALSSDADLKREEANAKAGEATAAPTASAG